MKLTHKEKVGLARKMRTNKELIKRVPIFQTRAWVERVEAIKRKVRKRDRKA